MKKIASRVIKGIFFLLVLYFLGKYFIENWEKIKEIQWEINTGSIILSYVCYFGYMLTLASLWHFITKLNHCAISYKKAIIAYLYSIPGKYIPGKVFLLAARCPAYEREKQSLRKVTVCFLLENACTLLGAAFLFLISLFFFPNEWLEQYRYWTILLMILFFVCIHPKIINFFLNIIGKITKKDMKIPVTYPEMLKTVGLFILNWLVAGAGFYLLVRAIYPVPANQWLYVGGIYGLSTIIGILAIFAPSGLGVREGILTAGLCLIMPEEYALSISLISRIWQTVAEIFLVAGAFFVQLFANLIHRKENRR